MKVKGISRGKRKFLRGMKSHLKNFSIAIIVNEKKERVER